MIFVNLCSRSKYDSGEELVDPCQKQGQPSLNLKITSGQGEPKSFFGTSAPGTFWPGLKADIRAVKTGTDDSFLVKR